MAIGLDGLHAGGGGSTDTMSDCCLSLYQTLPHGTTATTSSPGGWSDLAFDAEDTFFFSTEEAEDYVPPREAAARHELR